MTRFLFGAPLALLMAMMKLLARITPSLMTAGLLFGCGGQTPIPIDPNPLSPGEPPSTHPTVGDNVGDNGDSPIGMEPAPREAGDELPPGACESAGGSCALESCQERGQVEAEGTCYLNGEPQPNLHCCGA